MRPTRIPGRTSRSCQRRRGQQPGVQHAGSERGDLSGGHHARMDDADLREATSCRSSSWCPGNLDSRSGAPRARTASFANGARVGTLTLKVEPLGSEYLPNINLLDLRVEKRLPLGGQRKLALQLNLYNATNINVATAKGDVRLDIRPHDGDHLAADRRGERPVLVLRFSGHLAARGIGHAQPAFALRASARQAPFPAGSIPVPHRRLY